jgi:hypothetical protein
VQCRQGRPAGYGLSGGTWLAPSRRGRARQRAAADRDGDTPRRSTPLMPAYLTTMMWGNRKRRVGAFLDDGSELEGRYT